jgi:hypothetical protein
MTKYVMALSLAIILTACSQAPEPAGDSPVPGPSRGEAATSRLDADAPEPDPDEPCRVEPPSEPVMCTADWNPVCGCDGKTYSNACNAGAAGVTRFEPGECDKKDRL